MSPLLFDFLLAAGLTLLAVVTLLVGARDVGSYDPLSIALLLLQSIPLVLRRVLPVATFVVVLSVTMAHALFAPDTLSSGLPLLIAIFTVAEMRRRQVAIAAALLAGLTFFGLIAWRGGIPRATGSLVQTELAVLASWTLGTWARERREYIGTVEERATIAEQAREAAAERAVAHERERIAREMHDIVTHHVSVMVIQAGAAEKALSRRPEDARRAIASIASTGRQALRELRTMFVVLGSARDAAAEISDTPEPMPSMDRLGELIESVRAAGLPVELSITGQRGSVDPGVELSAYRIIQEALTNTLKHARGARSQVDVHYGESDVTLTVSDSGGKSNRSIAGDGNGRGLVGMRERVAMFGGELEAAPAGNGFRIFARLPTRAGESR